MMRTAVLCTVNMGTKVTEVIPHKLARLGL